MYVYPGTFVVIAVNAFGVLKIVATIELTKILYYYSFWLFKRFFCRCRLLKHDWSYKKSFLL